MFNPLTGEERVVDAPAHLLVTGGVEVEPVVLNDKAKAVLQRLCDADARILKDPQPVIELIKMSDSSIDITVRARVKPEDYWAVFFNMNELVYKTFPQEGLHFPFPQMDVHMKS